MYANKICDVSEIKQKAVRQANQQTSTITILANKLQKLQPKQKRWWEFDLEEGCWIVESQQDNSAQKTHYLIKRGRADFKDTVVSLLIDNSGSMRGRPITIAAISTDILAKTQKGAALR